MEKVISKDGTAIAFDKSGTGPPIILVPGAFGTRSFGPNVKLAPRLAEHFTVFSYDRRGRGDSSDTTPFAVEREVEDLGAVIGKAGGSASVYAISSGVALALEAANQGLPIERLALYEPPFVVDDSRPPMPDDYLAQLNELLAAERRGDAIKLFMTKGVGLPAIFVTLMRLMPAWPKLKAVAHTIPYDTMAVGDTVSGKPLPPGRWANVTAPALVMGGSKSPAWMQKSVAALADALPNAQLRILPGQTHIVKAKALAPVLVEFFSSSPANRV